MSYLDFKVTTLAKGSRSFFSNYPAKNWNFYDYFSSTHNDIKKLNNYKKIQLDYKNDLEWITSLELIPSQIKEYVASLQMETLPTKTEIKAHFSKPQKKRKRNNNYTININGNHNTTFAGDKNTANYNANNKIKEDHEKTSDKDGYKKDEISNRFLKSWIEFINNNDNFLPYSPEAHEIIQCGKGVDAFPYVNKETYNEYVQNHETEAFPLPEVCITYLNNVIDSVSRFNKCV